jgi:DNA-binding CsgD family transcriptional regulator
MNTASWIALIAAFLSGPTAFALLLLTYKKTGEVFLRSLAFSMLGLCFVLLGNAATMALDEFVRPRDPRLCYLIMNEVFLATVMTGAFLGLFAHQSTGTKLGLSRKSLFWVFTSLFFFLSLSLPIFVKGSMEVNVDEGYLSSTIYGILCLAYASFVIVSRRARIPQSFRGFMPPILIVLLILGAASVLNDLLHFGELLHGFDFPTSPLYFLFVNVAVSIACARELLRAEEGSKAQPKDPVPDIGLTAREKEVLPLIVQGLGNEAIAAKLFISPHTVKNHITSIFRKAKVANRFELLKRMSSPDF